MTVESTLLISVIGYLIFTLIHIADNIRVFRHIKKQKLEKHEVVWIMLFNVFLPAFGIFSYIHFHEKSFRESLRELKKTSLYLNFFTAHLMFLLLVFALKPSLIWDAFSSLTFFLLMFFVFLIFSIPLALFAFTVQLPNFFDRNNVLSE